MIGRAVVIAAALMLHAGTAFSTEVVVSPPGTDGWHLLEFPKIPRHTTYTVVQSGELAGVDAQANCSASAMYVAVDADFISTPRLHWQWKIERGLDVPDERSKAGDDFAARVYVMFRFDPAHASFWQRARHRLATAVYGDLIPGSTINYVWSSHESAGAQWKSPYGGEGTLIALGHGPLPQWTEAVVDVAADYFAAFGHPAPPLLALGVMTDSDNTCQQAAASYADFRFLSR